MKQPAGFVQPRNTITGFFILIFFLGFSVCRADEFGDISVMADAMYTGNTYHGYAPQKVTLENRSDHVSHVVMLNYPNRSFGNSSNSISRMARSVTLAAGAREQVTLLQPPLPINGDDSIGIDVDGDHAGEIRAPNPNSHCSGNSYYRGYYGRNDEATVLVSGSLDYDAACRVLNTGRTTSPGSYSSGSYPGTYYDKANVIQGLHAEVPAAEWSGDWLAYTPFDAVCLRNTDLTLMPPEATAALRSYVNAGGSLIVLGSDGVPATWIAGTTKRLDGGREFATGLGDIFVLNATNPSAIYSPTVSAIQNRIDGQARYWQMLPSDSGMLNGSLKLVDTLKIPTRGIIVLMLLFVLAIGPINIIVLNRRKRRTWMLWTIPTISVTTTLLVFAYSLLREGITPTVRITGFTMLDQSAHHAETVGAEGIYCPLTPSGGLHFDADTEVTPLLNMENSSTGTSREMDWSQAQHLTRGWVASRVPAFFHIRKSETCRQRVQVENQDGHLRIINGLGAPIKSLWYADADKNIYQAHDIAAGASAELAPAKADRPRSDPGPNSLFRDISFFTNVQALDTTATGYLTPGTYIAELDSNPFIENALGPGASLKRTTTSAVVFGILDPSDSL